MMRHGPSSWAIVCSKDLLINTLRRTMIHPDERMFVRIPQAHQPGRRLGQWEASGGHAARLTPGGRLFLRCM